MKVSFKLVGWKSASLLRFYTQSPGLWIRSNAHLHIGTTSKRPGVGQVTCSFGVAEWRLGEDENSLLKRADVALYQAKASGRNKVVAAPLEA